MAKAGAPAKGAAKNAMQPRGIVCNVAPLRRPPTKATNTKAAAPANGAAKNAMHTKAAAPAERAPMKAMNKYAKAPAERAAMKAMNTEAPAPPQGVQISKKWWMAMSPCGQPYYHDTTTAVTTWAAPTLSTESDLAARAQVQITKKWWMSFSPSKGRPYYHNTTTAETTWVVPTFSAEDFYWRMAPLVEIRSSAEAAAPVKGPLVKAMHVAKAVASVAPAKSAAMNATLPRGIVCNI